mgnify:CR=1 FL=1
MAKKLVIADDLAGWNRTSAPIVNFGRTQYWKLGADHTPDKDSVSVREIYHLHF